MSGLRHGWGRYDERGHADFVHGGVEPEDFAETFKHVKKRRKGCQKSKTGEECNFTVPVIRFHYFSKYDERWHYSKAMTCERCGKHSWTNYGWFTTQRPI